MARLWPMGHCGVYLSRLRLQNVLWQLQEKAEGYQIVLVATWFG